MGGRISMLVLAGGLLTAIAMAALSQSLPTQIPGEKMGRYSMSPADGGGFARLDTLTGAMSLCQRRDGEWTCREMAEPQQNSNKGLNEEIERLRAENQRLKGEIRQMEEIMLGDRRAHGAGKGDSRGPAFKLPTEEEVDQAMSYVQRMLRKFREKLKELETDTGKGTPL